MPSTHLVCCQAPMMRRYASSRDRKDVKKELLPSQVISSELGKPKLFCFFTAVTSCGFQQETTSKVSTATCRAVIVASQASCTTSCQKLQSKAHQLCPVLSLLTASCAQMAA